MKSKRVVQWILLRGLAREVRHWGTFPADLERGLAPLAEKLDVRASVSCIDLPGTGRYSEMRSPASIPEITEFVRSKYLEVRQRMREQGDEPSNQSHLVSISLGGMVASEWIHRWPDDFSSAVLINTSFRGLSPVHHRLTWDAYGHIFRIARSTDSLEREKNVLKMVSNRPELIEAIAAEWSRLHLERPVSPENFVRQLLAAARYEPHADPPGVPTLVLNSRLDRMVSPSCSEKIAARWNAEIRRHATAGHDLPLDDSPWVVDQLRTWWEELSK